MLQEEYLKHMPDFLRVVKKFLSQKARLQVCDGWMGGCVCGWGWWVGGSVCLCVHLFAEVIVMVVDYINVIYT